MFSGVLRGGTWIDPHEVRDSPPEATRVTLPPDVHFKLTEWTNDAPPPDLQSLFSGTRRPGDITESQCTALNINCAPEKCDINDMIPRAHDGSPFIPPLQLDEAAFEELKKSDPASRKRKAFDERVKEIFVSTDAAFRAINKTQLAPGTRHERLAHLRKFWEGVENMSRYWDTSLDNYFIPGHDDEEENRAKRQRVEADSDSFAPTATDSAASPLPQEFSGDQPQAVPVVLTAPSSDTPASSIDSAGEQPASPSTVTEHTDIQRKYKGRRTSNGAQMPDMYRQEAVTGFLEGVVWAFRCKVGSPRVMPRVQIGTLLVPVRHTVAIFAIPTNREQAREDIRKGPILGMLTRAETKFDAERGQDTLLATIRTDWMREVGMLLQLAQERHREGKTEVSPGEGKWWTTKKRWGGGLGSDPEVDVENETSDDMGDAKELADEKQGESLADEEKAKSVAYIGKDKDIAREIKGLDPKGRHKPSKRLDNIARWKELKSNSGIWDPKIEYQAIGKDPTSPYDEIFLVSSAIHHISILKLTVHGAYLDWLESGKTPSPLPDDPDWCRPKLQRTQWWDVFKTSDRFQAFQALWGVMEYLMRDTGAGTKKSGDAGESSSAA